MSAKLIVTFDPLAQPAFLAKAELICTSLASNAHFPLPWPAAVPEPTALTAAFTTYQSLAYAAESGDNAKIAARNNARVDLTAKLKKVAGYLELVADGDRARLETTGYDLTRPHGGTYDPIELPAPDDLRVERGTLSGVLLVRVRTLKGAGSYEVQLATADPAVETNWKAGVLSKTATHIELKGLTPGALYYVRVRGIGSHGPGAWVQSPGIRTV